MTMVVCIVVRLVLRSCSVMASGLVLMFVVYLILLHVACISSLGVCLCIVSFCSVCDGVL